MAESGYGPWDQPITGGAGPADRQRPPRPARRDRRGLLLTGVVVLGIAVAVAVLAGRRPRPAAGHPRGPRTTAPVARRAAHEANSVRRQPVTSPGAPRIPDSGAAVPRPAPGHRAAGSGPWPDAPSPRRPRAGAGRKGVIVAGVAGLVVVAGIGVAIGVDAGRHDDDMPAAVSSHLAVTSAAPRPAAAPGMYSMDAVTDACDLVDPTSLSRWSSTPGESIHREYPASSGDGGTLLCRIRYIGTSASADEAAGEAGISLQVQFTDTTAVPAYDRWSLDDTAPGPDRDVDAVSGIGARGYRRYDIETTDQAAGVSATVGVQDSNVSVRVEVAVLRSDQQSPAEGDELVTIAENQARATLDGLRKGR